MFKYAVEKEIELGSLWMSKHRRAKVSLDSIGTSIFRVEEMRDSEIFVIRTGLQYQGSAPFRVEEFTDTFLKVPPEQYLKMARLKALLHQCVEDRVSKEDIYNVVFEVEL